MQIKIFFEYLKGQERCGPRKAGDRFCSNFFIPAASPLIFGQQVALVHSYLHAKIHLAVSPFSKDIPILVKNQFLLNSSFTPVDMALALKSRKYPQTQAKL